MKMNKLCRFIVAIFALMMVFAFSACGKDDYAEYAGNYVAVKGKMMGFSITGDELNDFSIELKKGGKGKIKVSGESDSIKYTIAGTTISMKVSGEEIVGTISDDMIVVEDMLGMGLTLTFGKEGTPAADPANHVDETNVDNILSELTEITDVDPDGMEVEEKPDPTDLATVWGVWKGSVTYTDSWGKGMYDTSQDCTAIIDYAKETGRPFFQLYIDIHPDYAFIHTWVIGSKEENSLNTHTFTPDIGDEDCWVGNRYMVHDDGWYKAAVPAGYEDVFGKEDYWEDPNTSQSIKIRISTNKALEYAQEAVDDKNNDKAGSAQMYDDVTYNGVTWHSYGWTMFSDSINSVSFVAEAVSGQMMSVAFEMIPQGDPIVDQFMNSFSLADEAKDDPCAASRAWNDSHN